MPSAKYSFGEIFPEQRLRDREQSLGIGGFRAEAKGVTKTGQDPNTAGGKTFRGGERIGDRQFQHKICTAAHSGLCPAHFIDNRGCAPLHEISAHQAYDAAVFSAGAANMIDLLFMTQVKGIVFADNTGYLQNNSTFFRKIAKQDLRNPGKYYTIAVAMVILS